jgi:hypothetical protein
MNEEKMLKSYSEIGKNVYKWNQDLNYFVATALVTRDSQKILDGISKSNEISDPTAETVISIQKNLVEILQEILLSSESVKDMTIDALKFKRKVDKCFFEMEPEERRVIELRLWVYPEPQYTWKKVEMESGYCERQGIRIINKFIEKLKSCQ